MKKIYFLILLQVVISCSRSDINEDISKSSTNTVIEHSKEKILGYSIDNFSLLKSKLNFNSVGIGRVTSKLEDNAIRIKLSDNGFTHPNVLYFQEKFNNFHYWITLSPWYGMIQTLEDPTSFENPYVFASNDGINWVEPDDGINPMDVAPPSYISNGYWSDPALAFDRNFLRLFYRGNNITRKYIEDNSLRSVVYRESKDGKVWSKKKQLYSTLSCSGIDDQSMIVSPSFVETKEGWLCYDVVYSTTKNPIESQGNQTSGFVVVRNSSKLDSGFKDYKSAAICNFTNRPWGNANDPWHLEVRKVGDLYVMLLTVGLIGKSNGESLYLLLSKDGTTFTSFSSPLFFSDTYKSSVVPVKVSGNDILFRLYQSKKSDGSINLYEFTLKHIK